MAFDSTIRLRQLNQSELSGYVVPIIQGIMTGTGSLVNVFYSVGNPAGYVNSGAFISQQDLDSATTQLVSYISSNFYPNSNPSGYITTAFETTTFSNIQAGSLTITTGQINIENLMSLSASSNQFGNLQISNIFNNNLFRLTFDGSLEPAMYSIDTSGNLKSLNITANPLCLNPYAPSYGGNVSVANPNPIFQLDVNGIIGNSFNGNNNYFEIDDGFSNSYWNTAGNMVWNAPSGTTTINSPVNIIGNPTAPALAITGSGYSMASTYPNTQDVLMLMMGADLAPKSYNGFPQPTMLVANNSNNGSEGLYPVQYLFAGNNTTGNIVNRFAMNFWDLDLNETVASITLTASTAPDSSNALIYNFDNNIGQSVFQGDWFVGDALDIEAIDNYTRGTLYIQCNNGQAYPTVFNLNGGNVGFAQPYPAYNVDISGSLGNSVGDLQILAGGGSDNILFTAHHLGLNITNPIHHIDLSGKVGSSIHGSGNYIQFDDGAGNVTLSAANGLVNNITITNQSGFSNGNITLMSSRFVGVNTGIPSYTFDVNGTGNFSKGLIVSGNPVVTGNVVWVTGNQNITGVKTFQSFVSVGIIGQSLGIGCLNFPNSQALDSTIGVPSIDWTRRSLTNTNPFEGLSWQAGTCQLSGIWLKDSIPLGNCISLQTNKVNFKNTGNYPVCTIPSGYTFFNNGTTFSVPSGFIFMIDTMEVITTDISTPSAAPYISFGTNSSFSSFVNPIQTTSNSQYSRHIFDNPQDGVPSGTSLYGSVTTGSTALFHSGYFIYKGFLIRS